MEDKKPEGSKDAEENKIFAVLAYFGILVLVPLLSKKESKFAMFHAKQGLVLLIGWIAMWVLGFIPIIGWILDFVLFIALLVLSIMGIINAASGKTKELPVVGDLAKKFKF